ncbi:MAG: hypothetical protein CMQ17_11280 [Gammaproteobacteria bacterium]|nr:hypothetical protein [Gammaproteobacteria bacterium]
MARSNAAPKPAGSIVTNCNPLKRIASGCVSIFKLQSIAASWKMSAGFEELKKEAWEFFFVPPLF